MRGRPRMRTATQNAALPKGEKKYGRGTGNPHPIDVRVGARVRALRQVRGLTQQDLASSMRLTFQQVQKYEQGANRISASRIAEIANIFRVPVSYFFSGLSNIEEGPSEWDLILGRSETTDLVRCYYGIADENIRRSFFQLVKTIAARGEIKSDNET